MIVTLRRIMPLIMATFITISCALAYSMQHLNNWQVKTVAAAASVGAVGVAAAKAYAPTVAWWNKNSEWACYNALAAGITAGAVYWLGLRYIQSRKILSIKKRFCELEAILESGNYNHNQLYGEAVTQKREVEQLLPRGFQWWEFDDFRVDSAFDKAKANCPIHVGVPNWWQQIRQRSEKCTCRSDYKKVVADKFSHWSTWQPHLENMLDVLWMVNNFEKNLRPRG